MKPGYFTLNEANTSLKTNLKSDTYEIINLIEIRHKSGLNYRDIDTQVDVTDGIKA